MSSDYEQAVEYLLNIPKFVKKSALTQTKELLKQLGSPEKSFSILHIAGTNGKGSVCAFLSSMLQQTGKNIGLFTSPHLIRINERIQINGQAVEDEEFVWAFQKVYQVVQEKENNIGHPSFFEFLFALAMVLFQKKKVDYAVLEVGLGGRLDSTNIVEPAVTAITNISLEHTEILGDTLEQIAAEKAGIIKQGVPVIYLEQEPEVNRVIEQLAEQKQAPVCKILKTDYKIIKKTKKDIDFSFRSGYDEYDVVTIPFIADYQVRNAAVAIRTVEEFIQVLNIQNLTKSQIVTGLKKTRWEGRMEQIEPGVYLDGAHNFAAICELVDTLEQMPVLPGGRKILLFSAVKEKNYEAMIEKLAKQAGFWRIIVTKMKTHRTLSVRELKKCFQAYTSAKIYEAEEVQQALLQARSMKEEKDILICTGSLYLIGELKERWTGND